MLSLQAFVNKRYWSISH